MFYYVYLLKSKIQPTQLYVGYSTKLEKRFEKHNQGLVKSTKPYKPWGLIFYETYTSKKDAKRREQYFKTTKGRKALKLMLQDTFKAWHDHSDCVIVDLE